jgi:hypothetical protein
VEGNETLVIGPLTCEVQKTADPILVIPSGITSDPRQSPLALSTVVPVIEKVPPPLHATVVGKTACAGVTTKERSEVINAKITNGMALGVFIDLFCHRANPDIGGLPHIYMNFRKPSSINLVRLKGFEPLTF